MFFFFILGLVLALATLIAIGAAFFVDTPMYAVGTAVATAVLGGICIFLSTFWSNGVGEAKVAVNTWSREAEFTIIEPGTGFKPAWVDFVDFDLFAQEALYAGAPGTPPEYAGGTVNGAEITVSVGAAGASTQGQVDAAFVYNLNPDQIVDIYNQFRTQERFTQQIVNRQILAITRGSGSGYSPVDYRGIDREEVTSNITSALESKLAVYGIEIQAVTIQDVRYPDEVEEALKQVEVANQQALTAEANLRAAEVEAQQQVVEARAEADANAILSASLTPEVLEQRRIEALLAAAKEGNLIITDGSTGSNILIQPGQ